eukprot:CAMPEP_0182422490 /NCGR_PEP_ID=MMETSP1167-20130531/8217_1 /TAXON_ID=2988 /ORGANISM="Mallomonas Sp, Strain CCMP3275" /LENGTH=101 /DNA_ID=CAMNT_0024600613 /DNA_START=34 /DNA_END=336 /DNA_ORIENTATION=-
MAMAMMRELFRVSSLTSWRSPIGKTYGKSDNQSSSISDKQLPDTVVLTSNSIETETIRLQQLSSDYSHLQEYIEKNKLNEREEKNEIEGETSNVLSIQIHN